MSQYLLLLKKEVEDYYEIGKLNHVLIAGTTCNTGLIAHYKHIIDNYFTFDENLQTFIEHILEKEQK